MNMLKRFCFLAAVCLLLSSCTVENGGPSQPDGESSLPICDEAGDYGRAKEYFIQQRDFHNPEAKLTQEDISRLWYLVNALYNADDTIFVDDSFAQPPQGAPSWGTAARFIDFPAVARVLFTQHGEEQFRCAQMGGGPYFYQAEDGSCWHLGPWRTGYCFEDAMTGCIIKSDDGSRAVAEVTYRVPVGMTEEKQPEAFVTLSFAKEDGRWLIDSYNFPWADYPEEFTAVEEARISLKMGDEAVPVEDTEAVRAIAGYLQEMTPVGYEKELAGENPIMVYAIDNGRVYDLSVAENGTVWDNTEYEEGNLIYTASEELYELLASLLTA